MSVVVSTNTCPGVAGWEASLRRAYQPWLALLLLTDVRACEAKRGSGIHCLYDPALAALRALPALLRTGAEHQGSAQGGPQGESQLVVVAAPDPAKLLPVGVDVSGFESACLCARRGRESYRH